MRKNKTKNIEKAIDVKEILKEIKQETSKIKEKPKKEYMDYDELKQISNTEYMTKPMLFSVIKIETAGIRVKLDNKIITAPIGKYICLFTNNVIKIMTEKELQEIAIQI